MKKSTPDKSRMKSIFTYECRMKFRTRVRMPVPFFVENDIIHKIEHNGET